MGYTVDSPLDYMLNKWPLSGVQKGMLKRHLLRLCTWDWPALDTDWPKFGSFDIPIHLTPLRPVLEHQAPGQMDYWFLWDDEAHHRLKKIQIQAPLYPKPFAPKEAHFGEDNPPIYCPQPQPLVATALPSETGPVPSSAAVGSETAALPQKPPPEKIEDATIQVDDSATGGMTNSGLDAPLSFSPLGSPSHTRPGSIYGKKTMGNIIQVPIGVIPVPTTEGNVVDHHVHVPFTTADLMNWQTTTPRFRDDLDQDVGQFLDCLLCTEEKERVLRGARAAAEASSHCRNLITLANPAQWNPNDSNSGLVKGFTILFKERRSTLLTFMRLCKAFCTYTNLDPKTVEAQSTVQLIFISQSAPDIKKWLQQLEGSEGKSLEELVSVAACVYNTREKVQETKQVRMLAALVNAGNEKQEGWRGPPKRQPKTDKGGVPGHAKDMCNYCKHLGHWKRECPYRPTGWQPRCPDPLRHLMAVEKTDINDSEE
uniref:Core shell protein Gag P30 domain-containing protein n=1 Tax=Gopherus agassizii TaxID=38772 RepID=A0A452GU25_9SAUR